MLQGLDRALTSRHVTTHQAVAHGGHIHKVHLVPEGWISIECACGQNRFEWRQLGAEGGKRLVCGLVASITVGSVCFL